MNDKKNSTVLAENRKARFDYEIIEVYEAGMVLTGAEIKSIRQGKINLQESYIRFFVDGMFLVGAHVNPYTQSCDWGVPDPVRPRKLLMHSREIIKLKNQVEQRGLTIVPLNVHLHRGYAKLKIALAKGKANPDKRQTIKDRESKREMARELKNKFK
jgi:SsrA-binding protein